MSRGGGELLLVAVANEAADLRRPTRRDELLGLLRVCHDFELRRARRLPRQQLSRNAVRLGAGNWMSTFYNVWIAQILLQEQLQIPVDVLEHEGQSTNFYVHDASQSVWGQSAYNWQAVLRAGDDELRRQRLARHHERRLGVRARDARDLERAGREQAEVLEAHDRWRDARRRRPHRLVRHRGSPRPPAGAGVAPRLPRRQRDARAAAAAPAARALHDGGGRHLHPLRLQRELHGGVAAGGLVGGRSRRGVRRLPRRDAG